MGKEGHGDRSDNLRGFCGGPTHAISRYGIKDLLGILDEDGMELVGALATHYHPDHVGGDMMGYSIAGVNELLRLRPVPIHVQADEAEWVKRVTGADDTDLVTHVSSDIMRRSSRRGL